MTEADFIARRSPARMVLLIIALVVLSLFLLLVNFAAILQTVSARQSAMIEALALIAKVSGWLGLATAVVKLPSLLRNPVEIAVSADGLHFPPALKQTLPWARVDRLAVRKMSGHRVLAVFIKDADSFPVRLITRKVAALNRLSADYGDINIETLRTSASFDELLAAVARYVEIEGLR